MRFNFFVSLIFTVTVVALGSDNLFTLQESSEDLLPSFETSNALEDLYPDHHNVAAAAGDLFTDSTDSTDFSAGVDGALNNFESLEASCPSKNDQPSRRARTRRDEVCAPKDQPSINGLTNTLGIFGVPSQREEALQRAAASSVKADTASICIPPFLNHLCCQLQGNLIIMPSMPISPKFSGEMYDTMQNCHPANILPDCFDYEVCCQSVSYPAAFQQINADLDNLQKNGNIEALAAYEQWLWEEFERSPLSTGHKCYRIQVF